MRNSCKLVDYFVVCNVGLVYRPMITGMEVRGDVNETRTVGLVDGGDFSDVAVVGADGVGIGGFLPFLYPSLSLKRGGVSLLDE